VELAIGMRTRASLGMAVARGAKSGKPDDDSGAATTTAPSGIGPSPRLTAVQGGKA